MAGEIEANWDDDDRKAQSQYDAIQAEIAAIDTASFARAVTPEAKATAGAVIKVLSTGDLDITRGVIADSPKMASSFDPGDSDEVAEADPAAAGCISAALYKRLQPLRRLPHTTLSANAQSLRFASSLLPLPVTTLARPA